MPILPNPRHESFAQALAKGKTADEAYQDAGYKPNRGNAIRMKANESIVARVDELVGKGAAKADISVERVLKELGRIGFSDLRRAFDESGRLLRPEEWDDDTAAAIASVEVVTRNIGDGESADEMGIIVAGLDHADHGHVLEDLSERLSPDQAARRAIAAYDRWEADRIVGEVNNGGEWIGQTVKLTAKAMRLENSRQSAEVAYKAVHASRGKQTRAEPIAALDEQGRVHHVGGFPALEDQMCSWEPRGGGHKSPDRMDARVWAFTELMLHGSTFTLSNI